MSCPLIARAALAAIAFPAASAAFDATAIDAARHDGGALPADRTAVTAKVQILLDRAGISPGVIDGYMGGMTSSALAAFERREGFPIDGEMDPQVWEALGGPGASRMTALYEITEDDTQVRGEPLPEDYARLAELERLGFVRVSEKLAERFHMNEDFLRYLNPGADFVAGETIKVVQPGQSLEATVARIEVDKGDGRVRAFDSEGAIVSDYPATVGSEQTPSPSGTVEVVAVAMMPNYTYRPDENFRQGDNDEVMTLPPGPNGPVGAVWIDLSKPTYGLHGTAEPAELFQHQSHGCVRMTNWDAEELAGMVEQGVTVEFVE